MAKTRNAENFQYDVCLSFADEQRSFVEQVASALSRRGIRVFFDEYETAELWGKDLYAHLDEVYRNLARYCVLFASRAYADKVWTNHERRSAQARALKANREYILPARFDDTPIPGLPETVHYIDLRKVSAKKLAELVLQKVGSGERVEYLPPVPDRLYERLGIERDATAQMSARVQAAGFFGALRRMSKDERRVVLKLMLCGCPEDLPENVHINTDLLRRITGMPPAKLKRLLGGLRSLGFTCRAKPESGGHGHAADGELGDSEMLELEWTNLNSDDDDEEAYPSLLAAREMVIGATEGYCEEHGWPFLERLDFSQLATVTATKEARHRPPNRRLQPTASRVRRAPKKSSRG